MRKYLYILIISLALVFSPYSFAETQEPMTKKEARSFEKIKDKLGEYNEEQLWGFINSKSSKQLRRIAMVELHNRFPESEKRKEEISRRLNGAKYIKLGMTAKEVKDILGRPNDKNKTVSAYSGIKEQWIYKTGTIKYCYFKNGILISWQE